MSVQASFRLADLIASRKIAVLASPPEGKILLSLARVLPTMPKFLIDDVMAQYCTIPEDPRPATEAFPCTRPPFDALWIEAAAPPHVLGTPWHKFWGSSLHPKLFGVDVMTHPYAEADPAFQKLWPGARWISYSAVWLFDGVRDALVCGGGYAHGLTAEGRLDTIIGTEDTYHYRPPGAIGVRRTSTGEVMQDESAMHYLGSRMALFIEATFYAYSFLACSNVKAVEAPALPPAMRKAFARRRGREPLTQYKVLRVVPQGRKSTHRGEAQGLMPLHLVRGHFKDYRNSVGLGRGRAKGLYWWQPFARGDSAHGTIEKDYQLAERPPVGPDQLPGAYDAAQ